MKKLTIGELLNRVRALSALPSAAGLALGLAGLGNPATFAVAAAGLVTALASSKITAMLSNSLLLDDQTPNYLNLVKQIQKPNQVVLATFVHDNEPRTTIAAHSDPDEFNALVRAGKAMFPEKIVTMAENGEVIFSLATPDK